MPNMNAFPVPKKLETAAEKETRLTHIDPEDVAEVNAPKNPEDPERRKKLGALKTRLLEIAIVVSAALGQVGVAHAEGKIQTPSYDPSPETSITQVEEATGLKITVSRKAQEFMTQHKFQISHKHGEKFGENIIDVGGLFTISKGKTRVFFKPGTNDNPNKLVIINIDDEGLHIGRLVSENPMDPEARLIVESAASQHGR